MFLVHEKVKFPGTPLSTSHPLLKPCVAALTAAWGR
jgi:hypothetical protein